MKFLDTRNALIVLIKSNAIRFESTKYSLDRANVFNRLNYPKFLNMAESDTDREIFSTIIGLGSVTKHHLVELMSATQKRESVKKIEVRFDSLVHHGFLRRSRYDYDSNQAEVVKKATKDKKRTKKETAKKKKEVKKELDKGMLALIGETE